MLTARQFSVHWRLQACVEGFLLYHHSQTGERNGEDDFSLYQCSSSIHDCHGYHDCAGNPWAGCRGDRLVGAGQVHRKYWQCHQEVGMLPKSLMESHSSEKAPLLCFLQWSSRWLLLHPAQTVKGSPLVRPAQHRPFQVGQIFTLIGFGPAIAVKFLTVTSLPQK